VVIVHGTVGVVCGKFGDSGFLYQTDMVGQSLLPESDSAEHNRHQGWPSSQMNRFISQNRCRKWRGVGRHAGCLDVLVISVFGKSVKISFGCKKTASGSVRHHLLKCKSYTYTVVNLNRA
jgi:hypothetical protein